MQTYFEGSPLAHSADDLVAFFSSLDFSVLPVTSLYVYHPHPQNNKN